MLSKCANPECSAKFRYLHDGKVFRLELDDRFGGPDEGNNSPFIQAVQSRHRGPQLLIASKAESRPEYFWLCSVCSQNMTVGCDENGIVLLPLMKPVAKRAAAS